MPFDAYTLCPCGTGKKIKFCCPDLLPDLEKISRMLEGEQNLAALQAIEALQGKHPDRASLLAMKGRLLRELSRIDDARANAATFLEKHPENPVALAESAILTAIDQGVQEALPLLWHALNLLGDDMQARVYEALRMVCHEAIREERWLPARQLLQIDSAVAGTDDHAKEALSRLLGSARVPLLVKEPPVVFSIPEDAPWQARFRDEVVASANAIDLRGSADSLAALAEEYDDPRLWRKLGVLRGSLGDVPGSQEALRKYAAMDVPLDDAVEAEGLAMVQDDDPFGDSVGLLKFRWTVQDGERLQAALTLDRRVDVVPTNASQWAESDAPPPRMTCALLDRPLPSSPEGLSEEDLPLLLAHAYFFGRQTDREAEFQVSGFREDQREAVIALVNEIAADCLGAELEEESIGGMSATDALFQPLWYPPKGFSRDQLRQISLDSIPRLLLQQWPKQPLGVLDGKTPEEAAAEPSSHPRLLAVIEMLRASSGGGDMTADFGALSKQLGLPELEAIDPQQVDVARLPIVRLSRLMVDKATDEQLLVGFHRAVFFGASEAIRRLGREWVQRPGFADHKYRPLVYQQLAQTALTPDEALEWIEAGRQVPIDGEQGVCAAWDLMELPLRIAQQDEQRVPELVNHIAQNHGRQPGVQETLVRILVESGLVRPDGRMAMPSSEAGDSPGELAGGGPVADGPGTIWTPDSERPGGEKKLWTPD